MLGMGVGAEKRERGRMEEEEGLLTAAATRRNEGEERPLLLLLLLPLQLAPAALEARQAAVAMSRKEGEKWDEKSEERERRRKGRAGVALLVFFRCICERWCERFLFHLRLFFARAPPHRNSNLRVGVGSPGRERGPLPLRPRAR